VNAIIAKGLFYMSQLLVLHQSHSRLFLLLCFLPVIVFSYVHFLKENFLLAGALLCTSVIFAINFKNIRNNQISNASKASIVISMWLCLAIATYCIGLHGIFYAFPSTAGLFFLVSIRTALLISIPSVFILISLAILHGEPPETFKLVTSFLLTITFTAYSAYFSRHQQDAIDQESKKDPLTGLANRHAFNEWLNECHLNAEINTITTVNIDVDNFRIVNDTFGFETGDKLIYQLADKLLGSLKDDIIIYSSNSHCLARFSGDSFAMGFTNLSENFKMLPFVERIKKQVNQLVVVSEHSMKISASVAVVRTVRSNGEFANIIDNVDVTLKQAKQLGRNSVQVFDESIGQQLKEQKFIAKELTHALEHNQFHMVFMPIYRDNNKTIVGAELLLRCDREELKKFGPDKFIPIAEDTGLIEQIDFWVLNESFKIIANNDILRSNCIEFYSINISSHQLRNKEFVQYIQKIINEYEIDPKLVELEITETSLVETDLQVIEMLVSLRRIGFKLSLDDFGTGFTSFNQLKKYPLNCLKIDRSFVSGDHENSTPLLGMSDVILSIAKLYNFSVIAEGVETEQQYLELKKSGCFYFQGYWFSKPVSVKDFVYMLVHTGD
jgi:diguanylate cyclase (GGDEF)-like protein